MVLKAAQPYAGKEPKSVDSGAYRARNCFLISTRKPKGIRRPSDSCATTRKVRPPADGALGYSEGAPAM